MSPDLLSDRLASMRRRLRRFVLVHGLSLLCVTVLGLSLVAALLDWSWRIDDSGIRLILALAVITAASCVAWKYLYLPLRTRLSDVDLAMRIEDRYPGFRDSLASTVQFIDSRQDPRNGSPALQNALIHDTLAAVDRVDVDDVVEGRKVWRTAIIAAFVATAVALVAGLNSAESATALRRLIFPFSNAQWPRDTDLRFLDQNLEPIVLDERRELKLPSGNALKLFVENARGTLPRDVRIEYQFAEGPPQVEALPHNTLHDAGGRQREVAAANIPSAERQIWFRAIGGDHVDMPFIRLEIVPPPVLEELRVTLFPPAYTRREVEKLPAGVGHVRALLGTRVEIEATANKPLKSAKLHLGSETTETIQLADDQRKLKTSFVVERAGADSYWFELADTEDFRDPEPPRYELTGIADAVPDVYIEQPQADLQVTADAIVPLRVAARDDLALRELRVRFRPAEAGEDAGENLPLPLPPGHPDHASAELAWSLVELKLSHGARIVFHAEALDEYDLGPEHIGKSVARTLIVVSPVEKATEIASQQTDLLEELERVHGSQQRAHAQIGELRTQLETVGELRTQDADNLKRVELDQRRIATQLTNPIDGIEARVKELLDQLEQNHIDSAELRERLERMTSELATVNSDHLPAIEQELTQARKSVDAAENDEQEKSAAESADETESLAKVHAHQAAVLESLGSMVQSLSRWRRQQDVSEELQNLIGNQQKLNEQTAETGKNTLTRPLSELKPQEEADLKTLADRQRLQSEALSNLGKKLQEGADQLEETAPNAADLLRGAAKQIAEQATASRMRDAADNLERNNVGQALEQQQQALAELKSFENFLNRREDSDLESQKTRLEQIASELDSMQQRQTELMQAREAAGESPDAEQRASALKELQQPQSELGAAANQLSRRLRSLHSGGADASTERAAEHMDQAEENLKEAEAESAAQDQQRALDEIKQAQNEVQQSRQQIEDQLARELLEKLAGEIEQMIAKEQGVVDETTRLDGEYKQRGNWSRTHLKALRELAESQRKLSADAATIAEKLSSAQVFSLAVRNAVRDMNRAAERLDGRKTDSATVEIETAAKQRFADLIAALQAQPPKQENSDAPANPPADGQQPQQQQERQGFPPIAQLRMLKSMQESLARRTEAFDQSRTAAEQLTDEQQTQLDMLLQEQSDLSTAARELLKELSQKGQGEEQPDSNSVEKENKDEPRG